MKIMIMSRLYEGVAGGVERMSIALANDMTARGHNVHLLSWDREGTSPFYALDVNVTWHKLNIGDARIRATWRERLARIRVMRRVMRVQRPDVVISFQHGVYRAALLATLGYKIPVIAAERNAPQRYDHLKAGRHRARVFQSFRLADRVTVQFPDYVSAYPTYLHNRLVAIENPVLPSANRADPAGKVGHDKTLLCVGRLSYQKNQTVLIRAFEKISCNHLDWRLALVGDGEDAPMLRALVDRLGIGDRITFAGAVTDVSRLYSAAHLFCLASRWEGFPNAVAEAMAHGLPCVGFQDCAGMPQLIKPGQTGELAPGNGDVDALAAALDNLMGDDALRAQLGEGARQSVAHYAPDQIYARWEALFQIVAKTG